MKKGPLAAILLLEALLLVAVGCNSTQPPPVTGRSIVSETSLCSLSNKSLYSPVIYSPDLCHVAYFSETDGKRFVAVNGEVIGKGYDDVIINFGLFSPDSSRTAYKAVSYAIGSTTGSKWYVVIDGEEGDSYKRVDDVVFSPDSKHVAYIADGNSYLDRKKINAAQGTVSVKHGLVFSPNSNSLVYVISVDGKQCIVHNGNEDSPYDEIGSIIFSPDSQKLTYSARNGTGWLVVENGIPGNQYASIDTLTYSPDSNRLDYVAEKESLVFVVLDGNEGKKYQSRQVRNFAPSLVFSPDGTHLAYSYEEPINITVRTNPGYVVIDDEQKEVTNGRVVSLQYSPDSRRLAYIEFRSLTAVTTPYLVIIDGKKGKQYDFISDFVFSPDSRHYAFQVNTPGNEMFVVVDRIEGNKYLCIDPSGGEKPTEYTIPYIIFESAERFRYLARKEGEIYSIVETLSD